MTTHDTLFRFDCPHCGQEGRAVWKGDREARIYVSLSGGFHLEEGRFAGEKQVVVCNVCDEIDPPRLARELKR